MAPVQCRGFWSHLTGSVGCHVCKANTVFLGMLQVKLVEDACVRYLLQLQLPAQHLSQMMQLWDRLMLFEARKQMLQKYAHVPWAGNVLEVLPTLFGELLDGGPHEIALCKEVLFSPDCGALCELQASPLMLSSEAVQTLHGCSLAVYRLVSFGLTSNHRLC